jgi:hypothetical protein
MLLVEAGERDRGLRVFDAVAPETETDRLQRDVDGPERSSALPQHLKRGR